MKKTIIALAVIALVAPLAFGQEVLSRNAVGYVKKTIAKGTQEFLSVPFNSMATAEFTVEDLFPAASSSLPSGAKIYVYNEAAQTYGAPELKVAFPSVKWSPGTTVLSRARSFWMEIPSSASSNSYDVYMMGEVPDETNTPVSYVAGFTYKGMGYPVSIVASNINLAPVAGTKIWYYTASQGWKSLLYATFPTAGWTPKTNVLEAGQGYIIDTSSSGSAGTWNQVKPYTWP